MAFFGMSVRAYATNAEVLMCMDKSLLANNLTLESARVMQIGVIYKIVTKATTLEYRFIRGDTIWGRCKESERTFTSLRGTVITQEFKRTLELQDPEMLALRAKIASLETDLTTFRTNKQETLNEFRDSMKTKAYDAARFDESLRRMRNVALLALASFAVLAIIALLWYGIPYLRFVLNEERLRPNATES